MKTSLIEQIQLLNPWLSSATTPGESPITAGSSYRQRRQETRLLDPTWDEFWTILVGPRQAGKTTLGKHIAQSLLAQGRFETLVYLSCDFLEIRQWLTSPLFINELLTYFNLHRPVLFIDEVQRLDNPGLLLKAIVDLKLPLKLIASGSSQLEIKSKVQESLAGRHFEATVLPFSYAELAGPKLRLEELLIYGAFPNIWQSTEKQLLIEQLYKDYIAKDIIEFLRIGRADAMQKLVTLIAHSAGQLINYQQLAADCQISAPTVQSYLTLLEQTYVLYKLTPYVGNKRQEVTTNPIYYFIDNGFRNQALRNFTALDQRSDAGLLVEGFVLQELLKFRAQTYGDFNLHFWRSKSGAEVDFVIYKQAAKPLPIEVKYRNLAKPSISRGYRSFIEAYKPTHGIVVTKTLVGTLAVNSCTVHFIPLSELTKIEQFIALL